MKIVEIISQVYQITIRGANIILSAGEEIALIDTGFRGSSSKIMSFIRSLGRSAEEISLIIITHNHLDHAGGPDELRKSTTARVAAHKADLGDPAACCPIPESAEDYCASLHFQSYDHSHMPNGMMLIFPWKVVRYSNHWVASGLFTRQAIPRVVSAYSPLRRS